MNTNTMELNLNEMETVNGGDAMDHIAGAVMGFGIGGLAGLGVGSAVAGPVGAPVGAFVGCVGGAVAGGIVGADKAANAVADGAKYVFRKLGNLFS